MKILLTGASGYIGNRLLVPLLEAGHYVVCMVREKFRFHHPALRDPKYQSKISIVEFDLLEDEPLDKIPHDIDAAYYLVHSLQKSGDFMTSELQSAKNFKEVMNKTSVRQVIYLSGIVNERQLSKHLESRYAVEKCLSDGDFHFTCLRAGIIVGSGSASFEIIRDLVEKLPAMITPKWVNTKTQPISIEDVIQFLSGVLMHEYSFNKSFDIAGPDILTYKEMMLEYARQRRLKRWIINVPVMSPRLSSYWLFFVTSTSYHLAQNLVDSLKVEVIAKENHLAKILNIQPRSFKQALRDAFQKIKQLSVNSSWKDSLISGRLDANLEDYIEVPQYGCLTDYRSTIVKDPEKTIEKIWSIGGNTGWYFADGLWKVRGFVDKLFGGVGLRKGRIHLHKIQNGDALDFWRVILASKKQKRLLLYSEMKLPGEAWLEFCIDDERRLHQKATFRPRGIWGRVYWYTVLPFHIIVFQGMLNALAE